MGIEGLAPKSTAALDGDPVMVTWADGSTQQLCSVIVSDHFQMKKVERASAKGPLLTDSMPDGTEVSMRARNGGTASVISKAAKEGKKLSQVCQVLVAHFEEPGKTSSEPTEEARAAAVSFTTTLMKDWAQGKFSEIKQEKDARMKSRKQAIASTENPKKRPAAATCAAASSAGSAAAAEAKGGEEKAKKGKGKAEAKKGAPKAKGGKEKAKKGAPPKAKGEKEKTPRQTTDESDYSSDSCPSVSKFSSSPSSAPPPPGRTAYDNMLGRGFPS